MRSSLLGLAALLFLLPGCGGGSGNPSRQLATKLRTVQPGDQWVYAVTGYSVDPTGKNIPFTGNLTLALSNATFNGAAALALTINLTLTANNMQSTLINNYVVYLQQNPTTGDVLELGDNSPTLGSETLTTPQTLFPGTWSNGVNMNSTLNFSNGNTQSYALTVTGTSTVTTPAGAFNVWMANAASGSGITEAWAPQLGAPVKLTQQGGIFGTGSLTAVLQSTTVPH